MGIEPLSYPNSPRSASVFRPVGRPVRPSAPHVPPRRAGGRHAALSCRPAKRPAESAPGRIPQAAPPISAGRWSAGCAARAGAGRYGAPPGAATAGKTPRLPASVRPLKGESDLAVRKGKGPAHDFLRGVGRHRAAQGHLPAPHLVGVEAVRAAHVAQARHGLDKQRKRRHGDFLPWRHLVSQYKRNRKIWQDGPAEA